MKNNSGNWLNKILIKVLNKIIENENKKNGIKYQSSYLYNSVTGMYVKSIAEKDWKIEIEQTNDKSLAMNLKDFNLPEWFYEWIVNVGLISGDGSKFKISRFLFVSKKVETDEAKIEEKKETKEFSLNDIDDMSIGEFK